MAFLGKEMAMNILKQVGEKNCMAVSKILMGRTNQRIYAATHIHFANAYGYATIFCSLYLSSNFCSWVLLKFTFFLFNFNVEITMISSELLDSKSSLFFSLNELVI